jgi:hypothetical protein
MSPAGGTRAAAIVMVLPVLLWGYAWVLAKMALACCGPLHLATIRTSRTSGFLRVHRVLRGSTPWQ